MTTPQSTTPSLETATFADLIQFTLQELNNQPKLFRRLVVDVIWNNRLSSSSRPLSI